MSVYAVMTEGSYVNDVHLRGGTKNGTYWADYTPADDELTPYNVWITEDKERASAIAQLVEGEVVPVVGLIGHE